MHGSGAMGWGMGWWWIIGIIIIVIIVWNVGKTMNNNRSNTSAPGKSALEILKERYAKGDINKEEFEERKRDLI